MANDPAPFIGPPDFNGLRAILAPHRLGLRTETASARNSRRVCGYSTESGQTFEPVVFRLPSRKGEGCFLAGFLESDSDYYRADTSCMWACFEDASRAAHDLAADEAEKETEYERCWREAREWEESREHRAALRKAFHSYRRESWRGWRQARRAFRGRWRDAASLKTSRAAMLETHARAFTESIECVEDMEYNFDYFYKGPDYPIGRHLTIREFADRFL